MGPVERRSGDRGATRRSRQSAGGGGGGVRRGVWDRAAAERTTIGVMAKCLTSAGGTLINGTLVPIMAQTMTGVTCLMIAGVSGRERDLRVTSSPPGFDSLKNAFFIRQ